jgi:hypothetical protein
MSHPFPSTYCARQPHRRSPAADAHHLTVDRLSQAPSGQIGPTTIIPYPRPCLATTPSTQNRDPDGEPTGASPAVELRPVRPPHTPRNTVPSPPRWHVGPRPRRRPRAIPSAGGPSRPPARAAAPPLLGRIPPGPASRGNPFLFPFSISFPIFTYLCIY